MIIIRPPIDQPPVPGQIASGHVTCAIVSSWQVIPEHGHGHAGRKSACVMVTESAIGLSGIGYACRAIVWYAKSLNEKWDAKA